MTSTRSSTFVFKSLRWGGGVLLGLVVAAAVFEVTLRAMEVSPWWRVLPAVHAQFDGPDRDLGYAHRPNVQGLWIRENRAFVRINAQGLRDRQRTQLPDPGTVRIAVAGDSITEAMQVDEDDLFTLRAERKLSSAGRQVEILNFGSSGALPLQQLLFVAGRGLPMEIDAAVFIFSAADLLNEFMRNDRVLPAYVENASGKLEIGRAYRNRLSHRLADQWIGRGFFWLVDHSRVANALYIRARSGFSTAEPARGRPPAPGAVCDEINASAMAQVRLWAEGEPQWAARRLDQFLTDVPKLLQGKPTMFMLTGFGLPDRSCPGAMERRAQAVAQARTKVEAAGIRFVDLDMATLTKMGNERGFQALGGWGVRLGYGHLNPWGHEIYAQVLTYAISARFSNLLRRDSATAPKPVRPQAFDPDRLDLHTQR